MTEADKSNEDRAREALEDMVLQFGYRGVKNGRLHISTGGLSALELAFDVLGWEDPRPIPEYECEIDGCFEDATCGTSTTSGYKRVCGTHYLAIQAEAERAEGGG